MASTTFTSLDDDGESHGSFLRGLQGFLRQFITAAFNPNRGA